jgi:hypothetical protein
MSRFLNDLGAALSDWKAFWAAPIPEFRYPRNIAQG